MRGILISLATDPRRASWQAPVRSVDQPKARKGPQEEYVPSCLTKEQVKYDEGFFSRSSMTRAQPLCCA